MPNAWDKRPDETSKSYKAFLVYLRQSDPTVPDQQSRTLARTAELMGYSSGRQPEAWSAKYDWVARAAAYDAHMGSTMMVLEEKALEDYQQKVIYRLTQNLAVAFNLIERKLRNLTDEFASGKDVEAIELHRTIEALTKADNLARRAGKMPVTYIRESVDDEDLSRTIFVVGGDEDE